MKVVCIDNIGWKNLTIGKIYDVIVEEEDCYYIINDKGQEDFFPKEWFKTLAKYRNEIINKLLA